MTILVVDNSAEALASVGKLLSDAFPGGWIRMEHDPLSAAKYSYTNPVDVLLVTPETRPMNGWKLAEFVRQTNPKAIILMMTQKGKDTLDSPRSDKVDGLLPQPTSADAIRRAVQDARQNSRIAKQEVEQ